MAGVSWSRETAALSATPNPAGRMLFGTLQSFLGDPTAPPGVHLVTTGTVERSSTVVEAAAFVERRMTWRGVLATAGLRTGSGTYSPLRVSPRLTAELGRGRWTIRVGTGRFVQPLAAEDLAVARGSGASTSWIENWRVSSAVSPGFTRTERVMTRGSLSRRWERTSIAIDEVWIVSRNEPLALRTRTPDGWVDEWVSDRALNRAQTQLSARTTIGSVRFSASLSHTRSRDNIDPTARDAARSIGVPAFSGNVNMEWSAPHRVQVALRSASRSGAPYDVRSGLDRDGAGLFLDRGGWARNAALGRSYSVTDISATRPFHIRGVAFDAGIHVTNIFDRMNVSRLGSVINSPLFGRPLALLAGRSAGAWIALSR